VSSHRAGQPRYGRIVVLGVSLTTTAVALLGSIGVIPSSVADDGASVSSVPAVPDAVVAAEDTGPTTDAPEVDVRPEVRAEAEPGPERQEATTEVPALPADSGDGKRVVFSESEQRVWLVGSAGQVKRTYLVSGSLTDNLQPGTYQVYDRSEDAIGIDDSGTMKWFVRFTRGPSGAAIGFHTIPIDDGKRVQGLADLGTPQSHGCIRQSTPDAKALWAFAPLGSTVVVV
jgi:lipoprotein-anchoring transpeptidase ErfK/SrfK